MRMLPLLVLAYSPSSMTLLLAQGMWLEKEVVYENIL